MMPKQGIFAVPGVHNGTIGPPAEHDFRAPFSFAVQD